MLNDTTGAKFNISARSGDVLLYANTNTPIRIATNNTERIRIEAGGNVGIGTTSPSSKLTVVDNSNILSFNEHGSSAVAELKIIADTAHDAALYFGDAADNVRAGFYYDVSSNQLQVRGYNNGTYMAVSSNGRIGIGNTSPAEKLDVSGNIHLSANQAYISFNTSASSGHPKIKMESDGDFNFLNTAGASSMIIENGGNVGIGSTAPTSTLTVGSTTDNQTFSLGQRASANQSGRTVLIEGVANSTNGEGSGRIFFTEHNSTSASANLYGIALTYSGDNTPQFPSGATPGLGNAKWALMRHHNSLNGASVIYGSRTDSDVYFANNIYMPNALLHVNDTNTYIQFHAADQFRVVTGGNERFEVNNTQITANIGEFIATGDVGVGITSPNTRLHVYSDAGHPQVRIQEAGNAEAVGIRFQAKTSGDAQVYADIKFDPDSSELIINNPYNSGTQSLTVDSSSNVFIGNDLYVPDQIIHTGDTNTYMQFNAADSWRVVVAGAETIEANTSRVKVSGTGELLRLQDTSATANPFLTFYQSTTRRGYLQLVDSGNMMTLASEYGGIKFLTGTGGTETEKMVIQSDGDVGIGVTNPVNKLQVGGKIYSSGDIQAAGQLQGTDLKLDSSSSSQGDLSTAAGFIDIEVDGSNYIIPYFDPE
jgi:hypothetical protein